MTALLPALCSHGVVSLRKILFFFLLVCVRFFSAASTVQIPVSGLETAGGEMTLIDFEWSDDWFFSKPATEYNHNLARIACVFSENAYCDYFLERPHDSLTLSYKAVGADISSLEYHYDVDYSAPIMGNNQAAFSFATKTVRNSSEERTLVFVIIRGTPLNANEWISNINVSDTTKTAEAFHEGFFKSAQQIHNALVYYLLKRAVDPDSCCFLIAGHSRGAALANLVGALLANEGLFSAERIYDYTFAAPNVSSSEKTSDHKYDFIWNIVNAEDIVPSVPPCRGENWKYKKYGHVLTTVNFWNMDENTYINDYLPRVNEYYNKFLKRDFYPFKLGTYLASMIARLLTGMCKEVGSYYDSGLKLREKAEGLFWKVFPENAEESIPLEDDAPGKKKGTKRLVEKIQASLNKSTNGLLDYASNAFVDMHACEAYLSWLLVLDENELYSDVGSSAVIIEKSYECAVLNSHGEVMARIIDGILQMKSVKAPIGASIAFGKTVIYFPSNADFTVIIYKDSIVPSIIPTTIEHYDSAGYLIESCETKRLYPSRFVAYKFHAGFVTLREDKISAEKIYGLELFELVRAGKLKQAQRFRVQPEFSVDVNNGIFGGFHLGCRNIFGTILVGKALTKFDDGIFVALGIGRESNFYGHIMLNTEFFSKYVYSTASKVGKSAYVPALRFAFLVKPFRRLEFFSAVTFDAHIQGFNDGAFSSNVQSSFWGTWRWNDDFELVPALSFGVKF